MFRVQTLVLSGVLGLLLAGAVAVPARAQTTREAMWFAPTADDWKKPCLIKWQRTWEDAVAVSKETNRPILVCVNMDGEIASEHYAGVRYRQPEIAKLYEPYITVIASVYRHNPRDYDDAGNRIPCPRFGTVTCGEHIAIEPIVYEKYLDGKRIAPRHIMVDLSGKELYDVYYAWDTKSVFDTVDDGIKNWKGPAPIALRGDRSIIEKIASKDSADRAAVEAAFAKGDDATKRALLDAAAARGADAPVEVLRLAMNGLDTDLQKKAEQALTQANSEAAVDLISQALRSPSDPAERDKLISALTRIGENSAQARTLSVVHRGLSGHESTVNVEGWQKAMEGSASYAAAVDPEAIEKTIKNQDQVFSSKDADKYVELAESFLTNAFESRESRNETMKRAFLTDAKNTALKAESFGAKGWRVNAALGVAEYYLGNVEDARKRAESAVKDLPNDPQSWNTMIVLGLFADARREAISNAVKDKKDWPPSWLTDLHTAYALLAKHPYGTDDQVGMHYDFLRWLGGAGQAAKILDEGLTRFPDSALLHQRFRSRMLRDRNIDALEAAYETRIAVQNSPKILEWYAGFASIVTAEYHRRAGRFEMSNAAYDRAIAHYEKYIEADPETKKSSDRQIAVAIAGKARMALEKKDWDTAVRLLLDSFARSAEAANQLDGLNLSGVDTAKMLIARLKDEQKSDLAQKVDDALKKLTADQLALPAYEKEIPATRPTDGKPPVR